MRVICCQLNTIWENKRANFDAARALIARSEPPPFSLLLLPEMFASGFTMNSALAADGPQRETEEFLKSIAREFHVHVLGGVVRNAPDGRGLNEAVCFRPDGALAARYCKLHPFSFAGEDAAYAPGNELVLFPCEGFTVAPLICYDLRFPETFRAAVKKGATLFCVIANWPAARQEHWSTLLRARAIENQCYVAAVNRCGSDPSQAYDGGSLIYDMRGEILARADYTESCTNAEINSESLLAWRTNFPALSDIRDDGL
jgi:omega-amidase